MTNIPNGTGSQIASDTGRPLLSVGLPVYNGAKWLEQSTQSILDQSFRQLELIICDNASSDNTEFICRRLAEQDSRVRYYRNPNNIGVYNNFNRVFELSTGKYFKWAADSDYCLPDFFEKCIAVLESRADVALVYPKCFFLMRNTLGEEKMIQFFDDCNLQDEQPSIRFGKFLERARYNNVMHGIIRASVLRETRLVAPWPGADINLYAEVSLHGKFVELRERLFVRRMTSETSTNFMNPEMAKKFDMPSNFQLGEKIQLHLYRYVIPWRSPISFTEKLRAWTFLLKRNVNLPFSGFRILAGRTVSKLRS